MKTLFISLIFWFCCSNAVLACGLRTTYPGFEMNGVALQDCFVIPHVKEKTVYKLSGICMDGGLDRNIFYKMKDLIKNDWKKEQSKPVRTLLRWKIQKVACTKGRFFY